jgi:hypothetical protein
LGAKTGTNSTANLPVSAAGSLMVDKTKIAGLAKAHE